MLQFHTFVSSRAYRTRPLGGVSLSVVIHASLIAGAVTLTARSVDLQTVRDLERFPGEDMMLVDAARFARATSEAARSVRKALTRPKAARLTLPDLSVLGLPLEVSAAVADAIPSVATEIDLAELATRSLTFDSNGGVAAAMLRHAFPSAAPAGGAYTADLVERTVWPRTGNPLPTYPRPLLDAQVEASFMVRFVVDSTGRVDTKSIVFPESAHRLFAAAVRTALQRSRYLPAELGGHPVRQLVEQQFSFRLQK
jgi:TonB family protein